METVETVEAVETLEISYEPRTGMSPVPVMSCGNLTPEVDSGRTPRPT